MLDVLDAWLFMASLLLYYLYYRTVRVVVATTVLSLLYLERGGRWYGTW